MRWLADECVDAALVTRLRSAGHDASYIAETESGVTDTGALRRAQEESRLFLTEDKDFGELVFRFKRAVPGVVLLRIDPENRSSNGHVWRRQSQNSARDCSGALS